MIDNGELTITVTRSAGSDGAVLIFIDTPGEPDGSDGGPALRVLVNDGEVYEGVTYAHDTEHESEAQEQTWRVIVPAYTDGTPPAPLLTETLGVCPQCERSDDCACEVGIL